MNDRPSFFQWLLQPASILTLLLVSFSANILAQHITFSDPDVFERFTFDDELNYAQELLSPAQFLGYELGQEYTHHYQVIDYFEYLPQYQLNHYFAHLYRRRTRYLHPALMKLLFLAHLLL